MAPSGHPAVTGCPWPAHSGNAAASTGRCWARNDSACTCQQRFAPGIDPSGRAGPGAREVLTRGVRRAPANPECRPAPQPLESVETLGWRKVRLCVRPGQAACGIAGIAGIAARAGERGGGRAGTPGRLRMRSMTGVSRIAAMIFSSPPQFGQCSKSISNTRSIVAAPSSSTGRLQTSLSLVPGHGRVEPTGFRQRLAGPSQVADFQDKPAGRLQRGDVEPIAGDPGASSRCRAVQGEHKLRHDSLAAVWVELRSGECSRARQSGGHSVRRRRELQGPAGTRRP